MKKYRLRVGLDVDDVLYDCNGYALECMLRDGKTSEALSIYDIKRWGKSGNATDERHSYFSDPEFVAQQPILPGAVEFVRELSKIADVFFITAVPPACMSARALRLSKDFPGIPPEQILIGAHKDMVNLDILLDDGAHNIVHTPASYPVLFRKPWNQNLSGLLAVNGYGDFLHLVKMIRHAFVAEAPDLKNGGVVCLVGPTGSGKNAVAKEMANAYGAVKPLTSTTRPRRGDESDGNYRFLSEEEFIAAEKKGKFLETTVYSGFHFGTEAAEIDQAVLNGKLAVLPIDICGALTLKNRYRKKALLVFLQRPRDEVIFDIVSRNLTPEDKTCRILSLNDEYRNEELCDISVSAGAGAAAEIAAACGKESTKE